MLNKKSFLYQAATLAASNTVLLLLSFAYRVLLGRLAGAEGIGVYTLVMQVYAIIMSICVAGLCVASTHMTANLRARGDTVGIRRMTRFALLCFLGLLGMLAFPILTLRDVIASSILGDPRTARALWMILLCISLTGIENIIKAVFYGAKLVRYVSISEVGEQVLRIVLVYLLLKRFLNGDHGLTAFLILTGMTLSEVYSVLLLGGAFAANFLWPRKRGRPQTKGIRRGFLKMAVPSAMTSLLANAFSSAAVVLFPARLVLAGYTRVEAVSALGLISGMVMPILILPNAFVSALCTLLMPGISASVARRDFADTARKIDKGIEVIGLMALPATAMLLPFIPMLCALLFGQTVPPALAAALALQAMVSYYLGLTISILNGLGKQKQVLVLAGIGEVIQLALVWFLTAIPRLHVYGYIAGMLCGDLLRVIAGFICLHTATHTRPRPFHAGVVPVACAVILYVCARILFFVLVRQGIAVVAAMLFSLLLCSVLYLGLLRLLGVRVFSYLQRVVFAGDAAQKRAVYAVDHRGN